MEEGGRDVELRQGSIVLKLSGKEGGSSRVVMYRDRGWVRWLLKRLMGPGIAGLKLNLLVYVGVCPP